MTRILFSSAGPAHWSVSVCVGTLAHLSTETEYSHYLFYLNLS